MLHAYLLLMGMVSLVGADMTAFCRIQEEAYEESASAARSVLMDAGRTRMTHEVIDGLCSTLVDYSNTAFDTNRLCPRNSEDTSNDMWYSINGLIDNVCPNHTLLLECSQYVVHRMVSYCGSLTNGVQEDSPTEVVCQSGDAYLRCMNQLALSCSTSAALIRGNVLAAISSVRSSLASDCPQPERMQGDAPGGELSGPRTVASTSGTTKQCNVSLVNHIMGRCNREYYLARMGGAAEYCRAQRDFLACADNLKANCPSTTLPRAIESIRERYRSRCHSFYFSCLPEILDGSTSVTSYCLDSVGDTEPNAADYCRKMRTLESCLSGLRVACPFSHDNDRQELDRTASGVDRGLLLYC